MADLKQFIKYVQPDVMGCPEIAMTDAILESTIEFCNRTNVWTETVIMDAVKDQSLYPVTIPDGYIRAIYELYYDNVMIEPISERSLNNRYPHWRTNMVVPVFYTFLRSGIRLVGAPDKDGTGNIEAVVRVRPSKTATTVPDWIFEEYYRTIADGAKYYLHIMTNKAWSDPQKATYCYDLFRKGISEALAREWRNRTGASPSIKPCKFGG